MLLRTLLLLTPHLAGTLLCAQETEVDRPADYRAYEFDGPIFYVDQGYAIVEAETLPLSESAWEGPLTTESVDDSTYTGEGYMRYTGPSWGGPEREIDPEQIWQGRAEDWMVTKVWFAEAGTYLLDVRNYHLQEDGDNDIWNGYLGQQSQIGRAGDNKVRVYDWLTWPNFSLTIRRPGLWGIFTNGRSTGFGFDRIAIFQEAHAEVARDPSTPETTHYEPREPLHPWHMDRLMSPVDTEGEVRTWIGDLYFDEEAAPFYWTENLGWIYAYTPEADNLWLWEGSLGAMWTSETIFPWLYSIRDGWLYFYLVTEDSRIALYNSSNGSWIVQRRNDGDLE